jgi:hypothetical protein
VRLVERHRRNLERAADQTHEALFARVDVVVRLRDRHEVVDQQLGKLGPIHAVDERAQQRVERRRLLHEHGEQLAEVGALLVAHLGVLHERAQVGNLLVGDLLVGCSHPHGEVEAQCGEFECDGWIDVGRGSHSAPGIGRW